MSKILVTGAAGFIASSLVDALAQNSDNQIIGIDNFLTGVPENIIEHENYTFIKADCNNFNDVSAIMTRYAFDYVFHYAAVVGVIRTINNPSWVLNDIFGIRNILDLSKNTGVKRVFFSSSSEVYGEPVELPQHEERTPLNSRLPYAIVKNVGESYLKSYKKEFGLDFTIFRFFNTYGLRQSPDFVIAKFIDKARHNEDIHIYGNGFQTRTFCHISDHLDFTLKTLNEGLFVNEIANVGHHIQYNMIELAESIINLTNSKSRIVFVDPLEDGDMTRRQPDNSKMLDTLGRDLLDLDSGLRRTLNV